MKPPEKILNEKHKEEPGCWRSWLIIEAMEEYAAQQTAALQAQNLTLMEINKELEAKYDKCILILNSLNPMAITRYGL